MLPLPNVGGVVETTFTRGNTMGLISALKSHAQEQPDFPAIEEGEKVVTYRQLLKDMETAAANLQREIESSCAVSLRSV